MAISELANAGTPGAPITRLDFRRPSAYTRDAVRNLAALHELFTRRVASGWGAMLRAIVQLEQVSVDQATYDEYLTSMPSPNALALIEIEPLPAPVIVELNTEMALVLVDRLLGGRGGDATRPPAIRRLTEVETALFSHLLQHVAGGLGEALSTVSTAPPRLAGVEYNPQLVQVAAPSDRVVLLTYRVGVSQGISTEGLLTVCYPSAAIGPMLERLGTRLEDPPPEDTDEEPAVDPALAGLLADTRVDVGIALSPTNVPAADLSRLQPGDVLRLDHRVDQPVLGRVGETPVFLAHIGRRGPRVAVQLTSGVHATPDPDSRPGGPA